MLGAVAVGVAAVGVTAVIGKLVYDYFNPKPKQEQKDQNQTN